ncbi:MAG: hypothetical protein LBS77_04820 [Desulfovibrio sp.]|jgi:hypothetical protein|nr:hypothetical protein [Desulfovibrio sp.]
MFLSNTNNTKDYSLVELVGLFQKIGKVPGPACGGLLRDDAIHAIGIKKSVLNSLTRGCTDEIAKILVSIAVFVAQVAVMPSWLCGREVFEDFGVIPGLLQTVGGGVSF